MKINEHAMRNCMRTSIMKAVSPGAANTWLDSEKAPKR